MKEERIKERTGGFMTQITHVPTEKEIEHLIRTVAVEARKEGIEEVLRFFEEGEENTMWRPYEITDAIERLKRNET